jgi:hypothetical protein
MLLHVTLGLCLAASPTPATTPGARPGEGPPDGVPMMVAGGGLIGLGVLLTVTGIGGLAYAGRHEATQDPDDGFSDAPGALLGTIALPPGIIAVLIGTPLLIVGVRRRNDRQAWKDGLVTRLHPSFARSPRGTWTLGLTLRF